MVWRIDTRERTKVSQICADVPAACRWPSIRAMNFLRYFSVARFA
jgi:hypothetical protein